MCPWGRLACTRSDCTDDQLAEGSAMSVSRKIDCNAPQLGWVLIALRVEDEVEASATNVVPPNFAFAIMWNGATISPGIPPS